MGAILSAGLVRARQEDLPPEAKTLRIGVRPSFTAPEPEARQARAMTAPAPE